MIREKRVVILPMYNEQGNVAELVTRIFEVSDNNNLNLSIIAVNDCSKDETESELKKIQIRFPSLSIFNNRQNLGMAGTIKEGIKFALEKGFDEFYFMDSDLSHKVTDLPKFAKALANADVVIGSRYVRGGGMVGVPNWRVWISVMGNFIFRKYLGLEVKDLTSGYRAMRRIYFEKVSYQETGFSVQLESTVMAVVNGFKIVEVPILLSTRKSGVSSFNYKPKVFGDYFKLMIELRKKIRLSPDILPGRTDFVRQGIKFTMVGMMGAIVDFSIMNFLVLVFNINIYLAVVFSFLGGFITVFILNRAWTFKRSGYRYSLRNQSFRYFGVAIIGFILNIIIMYVVVNYSKLPFCSTLSTNINQIVTKVSPKNELALCANSARAIATGLVFFWNFFVNKYFTFKY